MKRWVLEVILVLLVAFIGWLGVQHRVTDGILGIALSHGLVDLAAVVERVSEDVLGDGVHIL